MELRGAVLLTPAPSAHSDVLNSSKLAGELLGVSLGSLLPPKQIRLLEATFLSNEVVSPGQTRRGRAREGQEGSGGRLWTDRASGLRGSWLP